MLKITNVECAFYIMKGIVLAGGLGTRLYPSTLACSKQILTIYDKPMVYYPIAVLLMAQIKDILIISTPHDIAMFERLLKNGSQFGVKFSYLVQDQPGGLAQAFILGEDFIQGDDVCLVLGDNIFYGSSLQSLLLRVCQNFSGATIFGCKVSNPCDFGVLKFDDENGGEVVSIEEKPKIPSSNYAVPGLYFYDSDVVDIAKSVKASARGELEITSVNEVYLKNKKLSVELFGDDLFWFDTGTHREMLRAANFVETVQSKQGVVVGCLEELAYRNGFISKNQLLKAASFMKKSAYGAYLLKICGEC